MIVKCLAQEHNTMYPAMARTQTALSRDDRTDHEATALPQGKSAKPHLKTEKTLSTPAFKYGQCAGLQACFVASFRLIRLHIEHFRRKRRIHHRQTIIFSRLTLLILLLLLLLLLLLSSPNVCLEPIIIIIIIIILLYYYYLHRDDAKIRF